MRGSSKGFPSLLKGPRAGFREGWVPRLPVGPQHSEDPCLICDLLCHLRRQGALKPPQKVLFQISRPTAGPEAHAHLIGVQAAALHAVAPEGQHTVLQTHCKGSSISPRPRGMAQV